MLVIKAFDCTWSPAYYSRTQNQPFGGTEGKVRRTLKPSGFIFCVPWMSGQDFTEIHLIVDIFQSKSRWWTGWLANWPRLPSQEPHHNQKCANIILTRDLFTKLIFRGLLGKQICYSLILNIYKRYLWQKHLLLFCILIFTVQDTAKYWYIYKVALIFRSVWGLLKIKTHKPKLEKTTSEWQ